jgi:NAD(P)-dependent dehydrogenase (short-subunit alcohol dehydrogenase family)
MLEGRVAFVTGGGSGIGAAAAKLFAQEGAKVALVGRTRDELEQIVAEIEKAGGEALALEADISDGAGLKAAIEETVSRFGGLDIVFANAGVNGTWAGIEDLSEEAFRKTVDINLVGTFLTIKHAVPHLKKSGGSVIVTSSVNGTRMFSNSGASAYASTKAAQVALTKMLALELAPQRIRVNVICPGAIDTEISDNTEQKNEGVGVRVEFPEGMVPLTGGKPGSSEQVAQLVLFLASDMSSHISGTEVWIDGAQSLVQG